MTKEKIKLLLPFIWVFIIVNGLVIALQSILVSMKADPAVIIWANLLLFLVSVTSLWLQLRYSQHSNPHAMVRSVMGAMALKLFGLGAAVVIYIYKTGANKNVRSVFIAMGLYIIYAWLEVRVILRTNKNKHAGN